MCAWMSSPAETCGFMAYTSSVRSALHGRCHPSRRGARGDVLTGGWRGLGGLDRLGHHVRPDSGLGRRLLGRPLQGGSGRGEAGDRHPVRRAGDVLEAHPIEEIDRLWIAAVLAADAEVEIRVRRAPPLTGDPHKLPHPVL